MSAAPPPNPTPTGASSSPASSAPNAAPNAASNPGATNSIGPGPSPAASPAAPAGVVPNAAGKSIVSVNSRKGQARGAGLQIVGVGALLVVVFVGVMAGVRHYSSSQANAQAEAKKAREAANKAALVSNPRHFETETLAPPAPPAKAPASGECTESELLLDPQGKPVTSASGVPMRVCKDGRVFVPGSSPAVPPVASHRPATPVPAPTKTAPSRYGGVAVVAQQDEITKAAVQVQASALVPPETRYREALGASAAGIAPALQPVSWTGESGSTKSEAPMQLAQAFGAPPARNPAMPSGAGAEARSQPEAGPSDRGPIGTRLKPSETPRVEATMLGDRDMILPRGRSIDCALATRVVTEVSGLAECTIASNVYSDNGRVLLLERGSQASGEYQSSMALGQRRLFLLWNRIRTPSGVVIDLNSPASDALGGSGLDGHIDNRWGDRVGAALLVSLVQDAIAFGFARERYRGQAGNDGGVYYNNQPAWSYNQTERTGNRIVEQILAQTLSIRPTLYKNQGDRTSIYVARDLDFTSVYELQPRR